MSDETWIPQPSEETQPFFDGAKEGKLRLQACGDCNAWFFPLVHICQNCGSTNLSWQDASGRGTVYSWAQLQRPYHPRHRDRLPLILAQIDIEEGARLNSNVVGVEPENLKVGDAVEVTFEQFDDGGVLPVFKPV